MIYSQTNQRTAKNTIPFYLTFLVILDVLNFLKIVFMRVERCMRFLLFIVKLNNFR